MGRTLKGSFRWEQVDSTRFQFPVSVWSVYIPTAFYDTEGDAWVVFCLHGSLKFSQATESGPEVVCLPRKHSGSILSTVYFPISVLRVSWPYRYSSFREFFHLALSATFFPFFPSPERKKFSLVHPNDAPSA